MAEVVAAFAQKYSDEAFQQLSLVLRLNHRKFPKALTAHVLALLNTTGASGSAPATQTQEQLQALVHRLAQAFTQWEQAKAQDGLPREPAARAGPMTFVQERLLILERALIEAGMQTGALQHLQGDEVDLSELSFVVREALWQLTSIVNGCERRWPAELRERTDPQALVVARWCNWVRSIETS